MDDPLDAALGDWDRDKEFSQDRQRDDAWRRFLARQKIVDTMAGFLRRMSAAENPGTYRLKQGLLHKETVWHVGWIVSEARGGFLLTPDGRLSSAGYGTNNDWFRADDYPTAPVGDLPGQHPDPLRLKGYVPH